MMIHLLDSKRGGGHEAEGVDEIGELVFLVQLSFDDLPAGQAGKGIFKLGAGKFLHVDIMRRIRAAWWWGVGCGWWA